MWSKIATKEHINNVLILCVFSYVKKFVKDKIFFYSRYLLNNVLQFKEYEYLHFNDVSTKEGFTYKLLCTEKQSSVANSWVGILMEEIIWTLKKLILGGLSIYIKMGVNKEEA